MNSELDLEIIRHVLITWEGNMRVFSGKYWECAAWAREISRSFNTEVKMVEIKGITTGEHLASFNPVDSELVDYKGKEQPSDVETIDRSSV